MEEEKNEGGSAAHAEVPPPSEFKNPKNLDPQLWNQIFNRISQTGTSAMKGGELISRRKVTCTVDGSECSPNVFVNEDGEYYDFEITLRSLSSADEEEALRGLTDAAQAPYRLCKRAVYAINGNPIQDQQKDMLWEALGMVGRQMVLTAFQALGSATGYALGKFRSSITVE